MSIIGSATPEIKRLSDISLNTTSQAGNNSISSQISTVNSVGAQNCFPGRSITNDPVPIAGDRNELHRANHSKQAEVIHQMLSKTFPKISEEMISSALCAGASGNLIQQEINYRPENSLILLSLLTKDEISREPELLNSASKLIISLNKQGDKYSKLKNTLNNEERAFDKKMESVFTSLGENRWQTISDRFVEKYVSPAIKDKLAEVFDRADVDSCNMNDTLVSMLEQKSQLKMEGYIQEYQQHGETSFADKALQLHNVFLELESKIEHIRSFKGMNSASESVPQGATSNSQDLVGDDVDAGHPRPASSPTLAPNTVNTTNYRNVGNTYNINHYHNGASSDSTTKAQNNFGKRVLPPSLPQGINTVINTPKNDPSEWIHRAPVPVSTTVSQDEIDGGSMKKNRPELRATSENVNSVRPQPVQEETTFTIELESPEDKELAEQPQKHIADIQWLLPKNTGFQNRYIRTESGWKSSNGSENEAKPVVTTAGGLNRSQADKEIYQGLRAAPQTVPAEQMFADSIAKADELFTGTERGALRANQAEVERYNDNAKRFP
ncbi:TPA: hypothetical protein ACS72K_002100 [Providencia alcalifaciens]